MEWLVIVAIILGPLLAIVVSRILDDRRARNARRMDIFRTLMRTRRTPIFPEHVGALNLIEIEFADNAKVGSAWKALFEHFAAQHARHKSEVASSGMAPDEEVRRNQAFEKRLGDERQKLLAKVLHSIAQDLGFKAEQLEIFEGGYTPEGWSNIELEQQVIRQFAVDLYLGRRRLPVGVMDYTQVKQPKEPTTLSDEPGGS